jgi:hypothetical protein
MVLGRAQSANVDRSPKPNVCFGSIVLKTFGGRELAILIHEKDQARNIDSKDATPEVSQIT